ncbi:hypothetical protein FA406_32380, partial [Pseudomonas aeruginosa]|nr:hypothetical protein [Pseudomonas aeruginosa]
AGRYAGNFVIDRPLHLRCEAEQEQGEERPRPAPGQRPRCVDQAFSTSIRPHISMCRAWQNQLQ